MIKSLCDSCGKEGNTNKVEIPCHFWSKSLSLGYADGEGNRVSGRSDVVDLCNYCKNKFYSAAISALDWQGMEVK